MKKSNIFLLFVITIIFIATFFGIKFANYISDFVITPEKAQLEEALLQFINRPTQFTSSIDIKQELDLDNKKFVLIAIGSSEGNAEFTKGFHNKYKLEYVTYGSSLFRSEVINLN